ncbi:16S rRNA (cytosine(1402)-N(4))-methyltransferase RsmH [Paracoccaceae bacterium GXU_MW_L88]
MSDAPHIPVLIEPLIEAVAPVEGHWIDGTFGAGGYARALVEAGASHVTGIDRDPDVHARSGWLADWPTITLTRGTFSKLDEMVDGPVDGVVLDIGVSSMQIDEAERGFSFQKDGPLDMRMAQEGPSAADLVNSLSEAELADLLYLYGEERASRRIARKIVESRPHSRTLALAEVISSVMPRQRPGQPHPATRSFQALRIAVNDELGELVAGLAAAERILKPGGWLAVVTFHSLEDRIVKRFMQSRSDSAAKGSRHAPAQEGPEPTFVLAPRKAIAPSDTEIDRNPRARSAKLRVARRTEARPLPVDAAALGMPGAQRKRRSS